MKKHHAHHEHAHAKKASHHEHEHAHHAHHAHKTHPHHRGAGMPYFESQHWEMKPGEVSMGDGKYTHGEMSNPEHLKHSVDALNHYANTHREKH